MNVHPLHLAADNSNHVLNDYQNMVLKLKQTLIVTSCSLRFSSSSFAAVLVQRRRRRD